MPSTGMAPRTICRTPTGLPFLTTAKPNGLRGSGGERRRGERKGTTCWRNILEVAIPPERLA
jgi:hypothetical protein